MVPARLATRLVAMLDNAQMTLRLCQELQEDAEVYKKFKAVAEAGEPHVGAWLRRSAMRLPSVILVVRALRRRQWRPDKGSYQWLDRRSRRFTNSVLCEDGFNLQELPEDQWQEALHAPAESDDDGAAQAGDFEVAPVCACVAPQRPSLSGCECPSGRMVCVRQEVDGEVEGPRLDEAGDLLAQPWDVVQFADLEVGRAICASDPPRFGLLASIWIGEVCDKNRKFVMRKPGAEQWLMPLTAVLGSAVLAWLGRVDRLAGSNDDIFIFDPERKSTTLLLVASFEEWSTGSFLWRSPAYFASSMQGSSLGAARLAVMLAMTFAEMPLLRLCAKHGFWSMGKSWLQKLSAHVGVPWCSGPSVCEAVFGLSKHCLADEGDDSAMDGLRHRPGALDAEIADDDDDALNALDEALEVLEKPDEKQVAQAKEQAVSKSAEVAIFREALKEKATKVREAAAKAKSKPAKRAVSSTVRKHKYSIGRVAHCGAKKICSLGAFVWRGLNDGAWWGRLPPFKRVSRSWSEYGEEVYHLLGVSGLGGSLLAHGLACSTTRHERGAPFLLECGPHRNRLRGRGCESQALAFAYMGRHAASTCRGSHHSILFLAIPATLQALCRNSASACRHVGLRSQSAGDCLPCANVPLPDWRKRRIGACLRESRNDAVVSRV